VRHTRVVELGDWIGIFFGLTPVWAGLVYGFLRLTGRWGKPEGVPPGRRGGMSPYGLMGGAPLSDAPYYARRQEAAPDDDEKPPPP
jgi:hypothetical protein